MWFISAAPPLEALSVYTCMYLMGNSCAVPRSVQQVLKESALVEAFNLKAAIEYNMKNHEAAREAMADAPPRTEEELDPVRPAPLHSCHLHRVDCGASAMSLMQLCSSLVFFALMMQSHGNRWPGDCTIALL